MPCVWFRLRPLVVTTSLVLWAAASAAFADSIPLPGDGDTSVLHQPFPDAEDALALDNGSLPADDGELEIITERYDNRAVKIQRQVIQDADRNYVNHGPWTMWDRQGRMIAQGEYVEGKRHGKWIRAFSAIKGVDPQFQGPFLSQAEFDHGQLHGMWTIVDAQQRMVASWEFETGRLHGSVSGFHANGQIASQLSFVDGQPHGEAIYWRADAAIAGRETFRNGKQLVHVVKRFDQEQKEFEGWLLSANRPFTTEVDWWNGIVEIQREAASGEGQKIGTWTRWHKNGVVRYRGRFEDGEPVGQHVWWHENGQRLKAGTYVAGKPEGRWTFWHSNGQKQQEGSFLAGAKTGEWTNWDERGQVVKSDRLPPSQQATTESVAEGEKKLLPRPRASRTFRN